MKINKRVKHRQFYNKVDMMKSYDRVECGYVKATILKLGFSEKCVSIVMNLVSIISYRVMLNGKILAELKKRSHIQ